MPMTKFPVKEAGESQCGRGDPYAEAVLAVCCKEGKEFLRLPVEALQLRLGVKILDGGFQVFAQCDTAVVPEDS